MFTEERQLEIINIINEKNSVTISELMELLNTSESTIRRDLTYLEKLNHLKRVHGGAILVSNSKSETTYSEKNEYNILEKQKIARYASNQVNKNECIFLDAGSTIEQMIPHLQGKDIVVVTNGIMHLDTLIKYNIECYIVSGKVKPSTKALVGTETIENIEKYYFDKCFIGSNAVDINYGLTTPDINEAAVKSKVISKSRKAYVLVDNTKFNKIEFAKFANINEVIILTNSGNNLDKYINKTKIEVVD